MSMEEKSISRGEELKKSLMNAVIESLDGLYLESILKRNFSQFLSDKKVLKINKALIPKFKSEITNELNVVFERVKMSQKLAELEQTKDDWKGRDVSCTPYRTVDEYCRSHKVQAMSKKKAELDFLHKKKQHHVNQLKEQVVKVLSTVPPRHDALEKKKNTIRNQCDDNALILQKLQAKTADNARRIACLINE